MTKDKPWNQEGDVPIVDVHAVNQFPYPVYQPTTQHVVVSAIRDWGRAKSFTLSPDRESGTDALLPFRAGQYISVNLDVSGCTLTRAYSLCSNPQAVLQGEYTITVERCPGGFASDHMLDTWQVGTKVEISEPLGTFCPTETGSGAHVVALAGGSGITPFLSMAAAVADGMEDYSLTILYGNRTAGEILFREELERRTKLCRRIRVIHVLSEEQQPWAEHGVITAELVEKYAPEGDWSVYVCGAPGMYAFLRVDLQKLNLPASRLRFEMSGEIRNAEPLTLFPDWARGKTFRLTVELAGETRVIPATSGESFLIALERAGIRPLSRCRCGVCGFCGADLVSGTTFIPQERQHSLATEIKAGRLHPCSTYPTGDCHIRLVNLVR